MSSILEVRFGIQCKGASVPAGQEEMPVAVSREWLVRLLLHVVGFQNEKNPRKRAGVLVFSGRRAVLGPGLLESWVVRVHRSYRSVLQVGWWS